MNGLEKVNGSGALGGSDQQTLLEKASRKERKRIQPIQPHRKRRTRRLIHEPKRMG